MISGPFCQRLFFTTKQFGVKMRSDDVVMSRFQICQRRRFHFVLDYCQEWGWTLLRFVRSFVCFFLSSGLLARNIQCVIWTTVLSLSVSLSIYHQLIYHCMDSVDNQMIKRLFGRSVVHSKVYFVAVYFCFWGDLVVLLFWFVFTLVKIWVKELDSKLPYSADLFFSYWSLYLWAVS